MTREKLKYQKIRFVVTNFTPNPCWASGSNSGLEVQLWDGFINIILPLNRKFVKTMTKKLKKVVADDARQLFKDNSCHRGQARQISPVCVSRRIFFMNLINSSIGSKNEGCHQRFVTASLDRLNYYRRNDGLNRTLILVFLNAIIQLQILK